MYTKGQDSFICQVICQISGEEDVGGLALSICHERVECKLGIVEWQGKASRRTLVHWNVRLLKIDIAEPYR
jgi:hypothetical protein